MKRNFFETLLGAAIILGAGAFFMYSYKAGDVSAAGSGGYEVVAYFSGIGGLRPGDDVQISGVKVGNVKAVDLDQESYLAKVSLLIDPSIKIPTDTAALISSESLLGGKYLALEPGADMQMIENGGRIEYTQAPQNLEQLLGQFIFSMQDDEKSSEN